MIISIPTMQIAQNMRSRIKAHFAGLFLRVTITRIKNKTAIRQAIPDNTMPAYGITLILNCSRKLSILGTPIKLKPATLVMIILYFAFINYKFFYSFESLYSPYENTIKPSQIMQNDSNCTLSKASWKINMPMSNCMLGFR